MERDRYGYIEFVEIQSVPVLFNEKPSFSELVARAREGLHCHGADDNDGIAVEDVLHLSSPLNLGHSGKSITLFFYVELRTNIILLRTLLQGNTLKYSVEGIERFSSESQGRRHA